MNKVRYHTDHQWKILETEHFEIYYYQECETLAQAATGYAEKAFLKISKSYDFVPKNKIPLFIYGTSTEFQETNITPQALPEGVGGFTEVFKNRIVVPMGGSYHEFEKVITHELTHAFQYDMIYGEGWRSVNLFKAVFVPNWMMEGMAEWTAQHWESQGEMVLRDAVLNDQVIPLNMLESFDHFEQVYMAYKESQSILEYASQLYGPEKVYQMMKKMASNQQADTVLKSVLGVSLNELFENWHFYIKSSAWARIQGMPPPDKYGDSLEMGVAKAAASPDGKWAAYLKGRDLVLWEVSTKKKTTLLRENFQTQGSGIAWSPDGKELAFASNRDGDYILKTIDLGSRKTRELKVPLMPLIYSPSWSQDQKFLLFSGFDYRTVDLYRLELATGKIDRLTDNQESESWACYSPDGASLFYLEEGGGETRLKRVDLDSRGLPLKTPILVGGDLGTVSSFRIAKNSIYLTSNKNKRIFNLYRMDLDGSHLTQLTNSFVDILSAAPGPGAEDFYCCLYRRGQESLSLFRAEKLEPTPPPSDASGYLANRFDNASNLIPSAAAPPKDAENQDNAEKTEQDSATDKKEPAAPPMAVSRLEVVEASNLVQLQWPVTAVEQEAVTSYHVFRSKTADGDFDLVGTVSPVRQGRFTDYDVQTGENYFYYVTAVNKAGESPPSPPLEVQPNFKIVSRDYHLKISPDILLFLAGYDSSFGFVGGGVLQMSDYLGDHRLAILGDTIPSVRTGVEANYQFSAWRTTVDLNFFYFQNFFRIFDVQTGSLVDEYRNNENGLDVNFTYPLDQTTRFEYGLGTQRFQGSPLFLRFSEGISNYFQNTDQWNVANYYRVSLVQDKRRATQFWPSSGYAANFTLLHAVPVLDANVSFANLLLETQFYADIGFLNHLIWANRIVAMTSQGPNPQSFFIGDDAPFQAFFTTIRGYGAGTFFGSNLGLWNMEFRYPIATNMNFVPQPLSFVLIKDIELAGFLDAGVVSNQLQDLPSAPLLSSIGTGIRFYNFVYQRALVMLRFDVAWRLDQAGPPSFHFNLTPMF